MLHQQPGYTGTGKAVEEAFRLYDQALASRPTPPSCGEDLREMLQEARELLTEQRQGSPARSPAHNARLVIDRALNTLSLAPPSCEVDGLHGLDTETQVFFYEQDFYVLSNFSAFCLDWKDRCFDTAEAAYHWEKFPRHPEIQNMILCAKSAHDAFKIAQNNPSCVRGDWNAIKFDVMRNILRAKANQHEYVRRKLLATGERELVENSWRDNVWGWGPDRDGQNMLGKLWMEVRSELRRQALSSSAGGGEK
jgi:ribA/ribD-fused uncharacterized protein